MYYNEKKNLHKGAEISCRSVVDLSVDKLIGWERVQVVFWPYLTTNHSSFFPQSRQFTGESSGSRRSNQIRMREGRSVHR